ncbi:MAG: hypothetical protein IT416_01870 [Candidatus Pacebacteria bacterium]|nr:hypothetical protein [Candidatus Paceibacterota bacterium]
MLLLNPDMRARGQLTRWETEAETFLNDEDRDLVIAFMAKIFALEDLEHHQPEVINEQSLFSEIELRQISEIAEKYPTVATSILTFFAEFLSPTVVSE